MKLSGFKLVDSTTEETPESSWVIPGDISADHLKDTLHFISQAEFSPPTFDEGVLAEHQLRRKTAPRKRAAFDDEDEDDGLDDEMLFPAGGPTVRKIVDEDERPKKTRKRRRKASPAEELDDDDPVREEKARKRRERELEKARKIKSAMYVHDGDDEFDSDEDAEFFARERAIAARAETAAKSAAVDPDVPVAKKRGSDIRLDISSDDESDDAEDDEISAQRILSSQVDRGTGETETDGTPVDTSDNEGRVSRRGIASPDDAEGDGEDATQKTVDVDMDGADGDAPAPVVTKKRPRVRGGFIIDSDDDE